MAGENDGQERTEEATPKRREEARKKGDIPRSKDLTTLLVLMAAAVSYLTLGPSMLEELLSAMRYFFKEAANVRIAAHELPKMFISAAFHAVTAMAPFAAVIVMTALLAPLLMSGWNFSIDAIKFKADKLNPLSGIKRIFGTNALVEMFKSILKFCVIGSVAVLLIWSQAREILSVANGDVLSSLSHSAHMILWTFLIVSAAIILIVVVDVPQQLWQYNKKLKMSHQQIKEEHKDVEGKPEVKGKIREKQQELARRRMMEEIPKADVIVTNPTHYSVALKYDSKRGAPTVIAKGADEVAFKIRQIGQQNNIPVLETPPLARALYYSTKINQEIPAGLYKAVAQVLAYVFQLRAHPHTSHNVDEVKPLPEDLPIPDEFKRPE